MWLVLELIRFIILLQSPNIGVNENFKTSLFIVLYKMVW